jgi:hypothetical protein
MKRSEAIITRFPLMVVMLLFGFFILIPQSWGQPVSFSLDFETGDLKGWTRTGTAFDYQPTLGDNPTARRRGQPSKHQGRYWIGGYERYQGLPGQRPGDIQGDGPRGTLTSRPFTIPAGTMSFLIGGGSSFETRVELLVSHTRVLHASGRNTETMHQMTWDLTPYAGETGQIRIVDEASGGWGHVNADDFSFNRAPRPPVAMTTDLTGRWSCNDGGTYFLRQTGSELWWYGQSADGGATWSNVFHGQIKGNQVIGRWADVPHGRLQNAGEMSVEIVGSHRLRAFRKTGGFGGSEWSR